MKKTGNYLMILGALMASAAWLLFPTVSPLHLAGNRTLPTSIASAIPLSWKILAGLHVMVIGAALRYAKGGGQALEQ